MDAPDLRFWFDPVCPFAWLTSKWVRRVVALRSYQVEWRLISLRLVNADLVGSPDYSPEHLAGHAAGLQLLRVAAGAGAEHGNAAVGQLYEAYGQRVFEVPGGAPPRGADGIRALAQQALADAGLPPGLVAALDDESLDLAIREQTDEGLALTGKDVGTPILQFGDSGQAFFGPVISRLPDDEHALQLWEHVSALAAFPGFTELKRSLRELPQLPAYQTS